MKDKYNFIKKDALRPTEEPRPSRFATAPRGRVIGFPHAAMRLPLLSAFGLQNQTGRQSITYYHVVGFVDGDGAIIREDRQHSQAHTEVRGQEAVAEDGFKLVVVRAGILDAGHFL